ncbi:hypothetical protein ScPMuIL_001894 [Solemya velum]
MTEEERPWGLTDEAHPELFDIRGRPPTSLKKPGQLPEEAIRKYFEDGYVIVRDVFSREQLDPCKDAINKAVEELAQKLYKAGKIKNLYSDHGFNDRLTLIEEEFPGANILLHKIGHLPEATVWLPLIDSDEQNGCLEVAHQGHKTGRVGEHLACYRDTWYVWITEDEMEKKLEIDPKTDFVVCEVPYGGVLLFNNLIPHRSLQNKSNKIRWSLDLRFQRPDLPVGFYGLKHGVLLRSPSKPDHVINWKDFDGRDKIQREACVEDKTADEFSTTIQGPWMTKWKIAHVNRHMEGLSRDKGATWHKP